MTRSFGSRLAAALSSIALGFALPIATGCSYDPDILASQNTSIYFDSSIPEQCVAGLYVGSFESAPSSPIVFNGTLSFKLVENGEILEMDPNSELDGQSDGAFAGTIHAALRAKSPCQKGYIVTSVEEGRFGNEGGTSIPFEGETQGLYNGEDAFSGFWSVTVGTPPNTFPLGGTWRAVRQ